MKLVVVFAIFCCYVAQSRHISKRDVDEDFAKSFLNQFGYYNPNAFDGTSDYSSAIRDYQVFHHLNATGFLDDDTKEMMSKPRCGVTDIPHRQNAFHGAKWGWPRKTLTYAFKNTGQDMSSSSVRDAVRRAFGFWASVTPLQFREVSGRGNMNIGFFRYSHGDNSAFDGPSRVLAHAYFPQNGEIHFDEDEYWTLNGRRGVDFLEVATHEIGHALGLDHSNVWRAVMWPSWTGYRQLSLHRDDIAGIQQLYGRGRGGVTGGTGTGGTGTGGTGTGGGGCRGSDRNKYCGDWARGGYCTNPKFINSLKRDCPQSCCKYFG